MNKYQDTHKVPVLTGARLKKVTKQCAQGKKNERQ